MKHVNLSSITLTERRVLRRYEHREVSSTAAVIEGGCPVEAARELKAFVLDLLNDRGHFSTAPGVVTLVSSDKTEKAEVEAPIVKAKKPTEEEATPEKEEKEVPAPKKAPEIEEEEGESEEQAESDKPTAKKRGRPAKSDSTEQPKKRLVKATKYDRTTDTHKDLLGKFLDKEFKGWRTNEDFQKAIATSKKLSGTDFLDEEGEILESFKQAFRQEMRG